MSAATAKQKPAAAQKKSMAALAVDMITPAPKARTVADVLKPLPPPLATSKPAAAADPIEDPDQDDQSDAQSDVTNVSAFLDEARDELENEEGEDQQPEEQEKEDAEDDDKKKKKRKAPAGGVKKKKKAENGAEAKPKAPRKPRKKKGEAAAVDITAVTDVVQQQQQQDSTPALANQASATAEQEPASASAPKKPKKQRARKAAAPKKALKAKPADGAKSSSIPLDIRDWFEVNLERLDLDAKNGFAESTPLYTDNATEQALRDFVVATIEKQRQSARAEYETLEKATPGNAETEDDGNNDTDDDGGVSGVIDGEGLDAIVHIAEQFLASYFEQLEVLSRANTIQNKSTFKPLVHYEARKMALDRVSPALYNSKEQREYRRINILESIRTRMPKMINNAYEKTEGVSFDISAYPQLLEQPEGGKLTQKQLLAAVKLSVDGYIRDQFALELKKTYDNLSQFEAQAPNDGEDEPELVLLAQAAEAEKQELAEIYNNQDSSVPTPEKVRRFFELRDRTARRRAFKNIEQYYEWYNQFAQDADQILSKKKERQGKRKKRTEPEAEAEEQQPANDAPEPAAATDNSTEAKKQKPDEEELEVIESGSTATPAPAPAASAPAPTPSAAATLSKKAASKKKK